MITRGTAQPNQVLPLTIGRARSQAVAGVQPAPIVGDHWRLGSFGNRCLIALVSFFLMQASMSGEATSTADVITLPRTLTAHEVIEALNAQAIFVGDATVQLIIYVYYPNEIDSINACAWLEAQGRRAYTMIIGGNLESPRYICVLTERRGKALLNWVSTIKESLSEMTRSFGGEERYWSFYFERRQDTARANHSESIPRTLGPTRIQDIAGLVSASMAMQQQR